MRLVAESATRCTLEPGGRLPRGAAGSLERHRRRNVEFATATVGNSPNLEGGGATATNPATAWQAGEFLRTSQPSAAAGPHGLEELVPHRGLGLVAAPPEGCPRPGLILPDPPHLGA